jgi:Holliday junction resolvasome RuvABC endonuclease subunit
MTLPLDLTVPGAIPAVVPGATPTIRGVDFSLTSTGVAGNAGWTDTLKPPAKLRGHERMAWLLERIAEHCRGADLVVVEGPSYGNQGAQRQSGHHERAGLWWMATHALWRADVPVAVAPPASVKKLATGKGNAGKDDMVLAAARRFPWFDGDNNACDALWLCAAGAARLGVPMVGLPQAQLAALDGIAWPDSVAMLAVAA